MHEKAFITPSQAIAIHNLFGKIKIYHEITRPSRGPHTHIRTYAHTHHSMMRINTRILSDMILSGRTDEIDTFFSCALSACRESLQTNDPDIQFECFHRMQSILFHLISKHEWKNGKEFWRNYTPTATGICELTDIENWLCVPGFAGRFTSKELADKQGCSSYRKTLSGSRQHPQAALDTSTLKMEKPITTSDLSTRASRLFYASQMAFKGQDQPTVVDLGGGNGAYYVDLRRMHPGKKLRYTCIDFSSAKPANADTIPGFIHVELAKLLDNIPCDLLIASGVLQYLDRKDIEKFFGLMQSSRFTLIDRTPFTGTEDDFWCIQTRKDRRHAFHVFGDMFLRDLYAKSYPIATGLSIEDFAKVFNINNLMYEQDNCYFKWILLGKVVNLRDFIIA